MLSILIPIYNYNVLPLVKELNSQCIESGIEYEILCQDDASNSDLNSINEQINSLSNCSFKTLKKNVAHRQNRNMLAEKAKYNFLLFIDGDSIIIKKDYISSYLQYLESYDVIYGGRVHPQKCPSKQQKLRWKYGKFMEDKIATERVKKPFVCLLFNNTVIRKDCFDEVKFDKEITLYGHDDTQLSYQLQLKKIGVKHINNPVQHGDIDTNLAFLQKIKNSLKNLKLLDQKQLIPKDYNKLLSLVSKLHGYKLTYFLSAFYTIFGKLLEYNLKGNNPSLFIFNVFRLTYFSKLYVQ